MSDHDANRIKCEREKTIARIAATMDKVAREPRAAPFRCVCGEETRDPFDPAWMSIHQPHFMVAGLDKLGDEPST